MTEILDDETRTKANARMQDWDHFSYGLEAAESDLWAAIQSVVLQITVGGRRSFTTKQLADAIGYSPLNVGAFLGDAAVERLGLVSHEFGDSDPREWDVTTARWRLDPDLLALLPGANNHQSQGENHV